MRQDAGAAVGREGRRERDGTQIGLRSTARASPARGSGTGLQRAVRCVGHTAQSAPWHLRTATRARAGRFLSCDGNGSARPARGGPRSYLVFRVGAPGTRRVLTLPARPRPPPSTGTRSPQTGRPEAIYQSARAAARHMRVLPNHPELGHAHACHRTSRALARRGRDALALRRYRRQQGTLRRRHRAPYTAPVAPHVRLSRAR